jgi:hypothetical protein
MRGFSFTKFSDFSLTIGFLDVGSKTEQIRQFFLLLFVGGDFEEVTVDIHSIIYEYVG